MSQVDKRERKFDDVCAYAYALLDTNESGSLSHSEFRSFIKNIMAKRTRYDLQECCGGGETAPEGNWVQFMLLVCHFVHRNRNEDFFCLVV